MLRKANEVGMELGRKRRTSMSTTSVGCVFAANF